MPDWLTGVERDGNEGAQDDSLDLLAVAEEELGATLHGAQHVRPDPGIMGQRPVVRR